MDITKINGSTGVIIYGTNIGVYTFKSKQCILIDTGINSSQGKKIDEVLKLQGLKPKYIINTHHHGDHTGGNKYFLENYPGTEVYSSALCKTHLENELLEPSIIFGGNPLKELLNKGLNHNVHYTLHSGIEKINDEKFEILDLKGHAQSQIGIITPDRVCFVGDSVFSHEILDKYSFPFLYNISDALSSLERMKDLDADYFVLGHCREFLLKEEFIKLIDRNIKNIENYIEQILELLNQPISKEDLMQNIIILNDLDLSIKQYFLNLSSLSGFLTYLKEKDLINYSLEEGKIYYYVK